jgi:DNA helicase-2/ATP-dependent DNA helicase PcrA
MLFIAFMEQKQNGASDASVVDAILEGLNPAQRHAVAHGIGTEKATPPPLLIAAGAGTGKTKTLAHRVARLILGGIDPGRLLLLTFTRRAALEMTRRAQQILAASRGGTTVGVEADLLPWSGTFHSIGDRLLRQYAVALALNPAFTVLDRADSADLMDLVRGDLGLARGPLAISEKGHLSGDLFLHRQCRLHARRDARPLLPMVQRMGSRAETALCRLCRRQAAR